MTQEILNGLFLDPSPNVFANLRDRLSWVFQIDIADPSQDSTFREAVHDGLMLGWIYCLFQHIVERFNTDIITRPEYAILSAEQNRIMEKFLDAKNRSQNGSRPLDPHDKLYLNYLTHTRHIVTEISYSNSADLDIPAFIKFVHLDDLDNPNFRLP